MGDAGGGAARGVDAVRGVKGRAERSSVEVLVDSWGVVQSCVWVLVGDELVVGVASSCV